MIEPPKPARGTDILSWALQAWQAIRSQRIIPGRGLLSQVTPSGTHLSIAPAKAGAPADRSHPFQLIAGTDDEGAPILYVRRGAFTVAKWVTAPSGDTLRSYTVEYFPTVNAGPLVSPDHPIGAISPPGALALDLDTLYGVWIVAPTTSVVIAAFSNGSTPKAMAIADPIVILSDSAVGAEGSNSITISGDYAGYAAWFIGSATVSEAGLVNLSQYRFSDIDLVEPVWVIPRIVSADDFNSISMGSDGGAYYEEP